METQYNQLIFNFIKSRQTIDTFVKITGKSLKNSFTDFKRFVLENYVRIFEKKYQLCAFLTKQGIKRDEKANLTRFKDYVFDVSDTDLISTLDKAVKKWKDFYNKTKEVTAVLYGFAKKRTHISNPNLVSFLQKWNMTNRTYYHVFQICLKKELVEAKKEKPKYAFLNPQTHQGNITKNRAKSLLREYVRYFFDGKIKTIETIKALEVLDIPINASISEISKYLD